jgi:hypothetical protein
MVVLFLSCKQDKNNNTSANYIDSTYKQDTNKSTFTSYPPASRIDSSFTYQIDQFEWFLNLPSLKNGVDSYELRFLIDSSFNDCRHLFVIRQGKDSLEKKHYYFRPQNIIKPDGTPSWTSGHFSLMHDFYFKNTDSAFISLTKKTNLYKLPTQHLIPGIELGCLDGEYFHVQIATKNSYRQIAYTNPECLPKSEENRLFSQFVHEFVSLLPEYEMSWYKSRSFK